MGLGFNLPAWFQIVRRPLWMNSNLDRAIHVCFIPSWKQKALLRLHQNSVGDWIAYSCTMFGQRLKPFKSLSLSVWLLAKKFQTLYNELKFARFSLKEISAECLMRVTNFRLTGGHCAFSGGSSFAVTVTTNRRQKSLPEWDSQWKTAIQFAQSLIAFLDKQ